MNPRTSRRDGQILVLFAGSLFFFFAMAALLYDGGNALVLRRQLQDAGDAAALAAANVIQSGTPKGCSATAGPPPGSPRTAVVQAAQAAVTAALPGFPVSRIAVSCPNTGWTQNYAVEVDLAGTSPSYFGGLLGMAGIGVSTTSQAVNGQLASAKYAVVELDPWNSAWPQAYNGCPSVLFSGSNTVTFDGSMMIDSACPAGNGGALGTNGNAAVLTFNNQAVVKMVGGYAAGALSITPAPVTGQKYVKDPLGLAPFQWGFGTSYPSFPVQSTKQLKLSGGSTVLEPGVYTGGIAMSNHAVAYLHPGIYVMNGGGFTMGAGNAAYAIPSSLTSTSATTWATDCLATNCGVLLYNTGFTNTSSPSNSKDTISVGGGATLMLRPYNAAVDATGADVNDYQNLLIWQNGTPAPASGSVQPPISLSGGGQMNISGTVYSPGGIVQMGGNSGGSGGSELDVTLQFISWDLQFNGNIGFHFYYQSAAFAKPTDYGLIK